MFKDTKGAIRSHKSKDRQYNEQVKDRQYNEQVKDRQYNEQVKDRQYNEQVKDRQYNEQVKKDKRTKNYLQNTTQKTKDRATRTLLKTADELRCSGRAGSSCSTLITFNRFN